MKLALCTDSFFPREGGAERQLRQVCALLATAHGWEVTVVTRRFGGMSQAEVVEGLRILRVGTATPTRAGMIRHIVMAAARARKLQPDAFIAIQAGSSALTTGVAAWTTVRRPAIALRLTGGSTDGSELAFRAKFRAQRIATKGVLGVVDAIVAPAEHLLQEPGPFAAVLAAKGVIIPNGVRPMGSFESRPRHVIWVGRADPVKGLDDLVALARRNEDLSHLAVGPRAGDGPKLPNLVYTGWESDPSFRFRTAAVFVSTSRFEGSPNSALEALAAGVPVVAYDIPAYRELAARVAQGVWLVPARDVDAMASQVQKVVAMRMVDDPRVIVRAVLPSLEEVTRHWDALLRELIENRGGQRQARSTPPL